MAHLQRGYKDKFIYYLRVFFAVDEDYIVRQPLCIKYNVWPCIVIMKEDPILEEETHTNDLDLYGTWHTDTGSILPWKMQAEAWNGPLRDIESLFHGYKDLYGTLEPLKETTDRDTFLTAMANIEYAYQHLLDEIKELEAGGTVQQEIDDIKSEARDLQARVPLYDQYSKSFSLLLHSTAHLEYATPKLFIVLPADHNEWNDQDPATHLFRLYFLCDLDKNQTTLAPQHIHLSNHPGYALNRPTEFFQKYGEYALTLLLVVRTGFSFDGTFKRSRKVPKLCTGEILDNCVGYEERHQFGKDNIGSLVKKAIDYLQTIVPTNKTPKVWLDARETRGIQSFLELEGGDNGMGSLYRTHGIKSTVWMCQAHSFEKSNVEAIKSFVSEHGGALDLPLSRVHIDAESMGQILAFLVELKETKRIMDVSVSFGWVPKRSVLILSTCLSNIGVRVLQLDGVGMDCHTHRCIEYGLSVFVMAQRMSLENNSVPMDKIILRHYPEQSDQYVHFGTSADAKLGLRSRMSRTATNIDWFELEPCLELIAGIFTDRTGRRLKKMIDFHLEELTRELFPHRALSLRSIDIFDKSTLRWQAQIGITDSGVVQGLVAAVIPSVILRREFLECGTLQRLIFQTHDHVDFAYFRTLVGFNPGLREIEVLIREEKVVQWIEHIYEICIAESIEARITLFEEGVLHEFEVGYSDTKLENQEGDEDKQEDGDETVGVMQEDRGSERGVESDESQEDLDGQQDDGQDGSGEDEDANGLSVERRNIASFVTRRQRSKMGLKEQSIEFDIQQWSSDYFSAPLTDDQAELLDMATGSHSSVLTNITLETSALSSKGLACVRNILQRSGIEYLHIKCGAFDPTLRDDLIRVLSAVHLPVIKKLSLSGNCIDDWIQLWNDSVSFQDLFSAYGLLDLQISSLDIIGTSAEGHSMSHSSVLSIHQLLYYSSLKEVSFRHIQMEDGRDWDLISAMVEGVAHK
ncbi:hypothetical protein BG000_007783 [Podila horticola]|nr:hypothetical protein BG000_007783 [Podila horticola]